jgi:hypothetical protein
MSKDSEKLARKIPHTAARVREGEDAASLHPMLKMQRRAGNRAVVNLLKGGGLVQTKLRTSEPGNEHLSSAAPQIQRAPRNGNSAGAVTPNTAPENAPEPATSTAGPLIVEDEAATVAPGQMRKSEFLEQLRSTVCTTADEALKAAGESTEGCPYIEQWLSYYEDQEPSHIERALRKYAPEAAAATSARDYIPAVSNRVRRAVETWARTGEITGVPPELAGLLNGPGAALGAVAGVLGSIGSAIGGAISAAAGAIGGAFSSIGKALFKRKEGQHGASAGVTNDAAEIQQQLSGGQPLDSAAGSRLGAAFGHDFSGVRVHTDAGAAGLSDRLNARAFTIGSDIAFGAGEYQPGTLIGDALIAHELAHVVQQQGGGNGSTAPQSKDAGGHDALEEEADVAAVGAVVSAWGGVTAALSDAGRNAIPRMRSGLRLQSCGGRAPTSKYVTNRSGAVESHEEGTQPNQPDLTDAQSDAILNQAYPGLRAKLKQVAPPTDSYNCHGYTFTNGATWISDPEVDDILKDNGYLVTTEPRVLDIVIYRVNGKVKHSGIVTAVAGGKVTKINSKWGRHGLYSHAPQDVPQGPPTPYGTFTTWYTERPEKNKLRERPTK